MRSTGIVRKVDELGRVVVPIEIRKAHGINEGDPIEIFVDGEKIVLRKYLPACLQFFRVTIHSLGVEVSIRPKKFHHLTGHYPS